MVRNNSQLNNSQSQALAENNSTFNIQNPTLPKATIQHSKFNIAVGFVPMFSVKCLMLNCYGAKQLTTEQLSIAGFSRE